jgi:hypothetical protein
VCRHRLEHRSVDRGLGFELMALLLRVAPQALALCRRQVVVVRFRLNSLQSVASG